MTLSPFRSLEILEDRTVPAVQVVFNYDFDASGFFADAGRRAVLQQAADAITLQFNDQLSAITPGGGNTWTAQFDNPATGGSTTINNLAVGQNQVVIFAGARNLGGPLGIGGYSAGAVAVNGSSSFRDAIQTRGQGNIFAQNATDFATWGGSIVFDNTTNWSFATSASGVGSNQFAFYSVALHELGHVFGLGTAPSFENKISNNAFFGSNAVAAYNGSAAPVTSDHGHWAQSVTSGGQTAIMVPVLTNGQFRTFTPLDTAALADVGWQVAGITPTPTPTPTPAPTPTPVPVADQSRRIFATGTEAGSAPHVKVYDATGALRLSFFAYDSAFRNGRPGGDRRCHRRRLRRRGRRPGHRRIAASESLRRPNWRSRPSDVRLRHLLDVRHLHRPGRREPRWPGRPDRQPWGWLESARTGVSTGPPASRSANSSRTIRRISAGSTSPPATWTATASADIITGTGFGGLGAVREFRGTDNGLSREYFAYPTAFLGRRHRGGRRH